MKQQSLAVLRCPKCHGSLRMVGNDQRADSECLDDAELTCAGCGHVWPVRGGSPHLVWPEQLEGPDLRSRRLWNRVAPLWRIILGLTNVVRGVSDGDERRKLVRRLELQPGDVVLETASGAGANLACIARETEGVSVFGVDLSPRMLGAARKRLDAVSESPELIIGNATDLPFTDDAFDAVLDGFGMKYYSDKRRAMQEMLRVVKPGGKVVVTELGVPSRSELTFRQRLLLLFVPGVGEPPTRDLIPTDADPHIEWDAHHTAYMIEFRKPESAAVVRDAATS